MFLEIPRRVGANFLGGAFPVTPALFRSSLLHINICWLQIGDTHGFLCCGFWYCSNRTHFKVVIIPNVDRKLSGKASPNKEPIHSNNKPSKSRLTRTWSICHRSWLVKWKLSWSTMLLSKRNVSYRFYPRETSYGRSSDPPPPLLETSRTFFDFAEGPEALFILQALRLSCCVSKV